MVNKAIDNINLFFPDHQYDYMLSKTVSLRRASTGLHSKM